MDLRDNERHKDSRLEQEGEFLEAVLESLNHPFYVIDADSYVIKLANSASQFGPLIDSPTCYALTHHRDTPCEDEEHPCVLKMIKETGKPVVAEHIHFDNKGEARIFEIHGYPLFDRNGKVDRIIEYNLDITKRKRAEESLRDAHQLLENIFNHTHIGIAYMDPQFNFIRVNHAYARADNRKPSFFPGKNHFDLYPNQKNETIFRDVVDTGDIHSEMAKPFVYADAPERGVSYWDWNLVPIKNKKGEVAGLILTMQNVTARREAEKKVEDSLREKELLLKEVYHRVKNNLSVIHSLLALQSDFIKDETSREMLGESMGRIKAMGQVHERLYRSDDLSKINFSDYMEDMIDGIYDSFGLGFQNVMIEKKIEKMALGLDRAIPCGLIVNEMLTNCMKHAFPDGRSGLITVVLRFKKEDMIELIIDDDGVGLPDDLDLQHHDSLGITLIKSLVRQIGGEIAISGRKGTEFRIIFPRN